MEVSFKTENSSFSLISVMEFFKIGEIFIFTRINPPGKTMQTKTDDKVIRL